MRADAELNRIAGQLISLYAPDKLLLFGSQAKRTARKNSDIDLCVVKNTEDKRRLLAHMYLNIESEKPFDLLLYTPEEWARSVHDRTSFAYLINREGVVLHG